VRNFRTEIQAPNSPLHESDGEGGRGAYVHGVQYEFFLLVLIPNHSN
jgi:hypothetical protein